jgi:hypothetical protein
MLLDKVSDQDDALLHAALLQVGASRVLRGLEDMDPMLEDVQVRCLRPAASCPLQCPIA